MFCNVKRTDIKTFSSEKLQPRLPSRQQHPDEEQLIGKEQSTVASSDAQQV